ncbi:hypothetical protein LTT66_32550 [Nocardia gipuzkoensis]|uniref:hypothetical protein n=1 Tax=Nocardia gipuzkoensis TaxID=2749991 RepID=UPI001E466145|nr:hypothetical protein [Nocardia gipuzkoensis]UGT67858.1 hypothetical protein LTT66_32550 [Nocardia gipuzkoensis]
MHPDPEKYGFYALSDEHRANGVLPTLGGNRTCFAREMLIGLCNIVHPHGPVDELKTFQQYVTVIRRSVDELAERGHVGVAADTAGVRDDHPRRVRRAPGGAGGG